VFQLVTTADLCNNLCTPYRSYFEKIQPAIPPWMAANLQIPALFPFSKARLRSSDKARTVKLPGTYAAGLPVIPSFEFHF
jgi:hypothetical protein